MKVKIKYLDCGTFGSLIDCDAPRIFCPFCKERNVNFTEIKEVTPQELYSLLKYNRDKIISI